MATDAKEWQNNASFCIEKMIEAVDFRINDFKEARESIDFNLNEILNVHFSDSNDKKINIVILDELDDIAKTCETMALKFHRTRALFWTYYNVKILEEDLKANKEKFIGRFHSYMYVPKNETEFKEEIKNDIKTTLDECLKITLKPFYNNKEQLLELQNNIEFTNEKTTLMLLKAFQDFQKFDPWNDYFHTLDTGLGYNKLFWELDYVKLIIEEKKTAQQEQQPEHQVERKSRSR